MTDLPAETTRFEDGDFVEIKVNGKVVGRVEERPESSLAAEDEAALALEVDQLVESMTELLRDVHDADPEAGESISAEIIGYRDDEVEMTENPPKATNFDDAKYVEVKRNGKIIGRVEHRVASTMTDSELAGFNLILEEMVDDVKSELEDSYARSPYEILKETGSTVEINIAGTDEWITRVE